MNNRDSIGNSNSTSPETHQLNKPVALFCYLCGREFGTNSLSIHIPKCKIKREATIKEILGDMKIEEPNPPEDSIPEKGPNFIERVEHYNQQAYKIYEDFSRFPCTNCKRRFNAEALIVHLKSCRPNSSSSSSGYKVPGQRPRMIMCCICGQEYGSLSLSIHQKTCMQKHGWTKEDLEKRQLKTNIGQLSEKALEEFNNHAYNSYFEHTLVPCQNCGRKFLPDRLEVHFKSCKPGKTSKPLNHFPSRN
jgi:hypothetical protein